MDAKDQARRATEYLERAAEAEARAEACLDPAVRKGFQELATQWRTMAEQSEAASASQSEPLPDPET